MKVITVTAFVGLLFVLPAAAQDKPTPPDQGSGKEALAQCKNAVLAEGLDDHARREAIAACILKARPEIANRIHCLTDSRLKDMDRAGRMAFLKDCAEGKK